MLGPFATACRFTLSFTRCRYCRHCRMPPAHRCPRRRRRQQQRVTEGSAMAPWNGPNNTLHVYTYIIESWNGTGICTFRPKDSLGLSYPFTSNLTRGSLTLRASRYATGATAGLLRSADGHCQRQRQFAADARRDLWTCCLCCALRHRARGEPSRCTHHCCLRCPRCRRKTA